MERHRTLSILLALHVPVLIAFGIVRGQGVLHSVGEVSLAALLLGLAQLRAVPRRIKGILISAGLVWCSAVAVHFSGGMIEAHFHFFVILGFIALYQDWAAFGWAIVFTALSHGVGSAISPDLMFSHEAGQQQPWTWAAIHAAMVLFAASGQVIGWRHAEVNQNRVTELNTALLREQAERQASYSRIYVNLARRNQSLLHRQLAVIDELEQHEEDPDTLRRLFSLDHLTTRVRRNAESLLVVAGEESPRRWKTAVSLADIARAAASEIEQYERTDVRVADDVAITGTAVIDITHLLAELIENAAEYSSPETTVVVTGGTKDGGAQITIEDLGIGMSEKDLLAANEVLREPPELDEQQVRQLGFQVVGRLAQKMGLTVRLRPTVGGSGPRAGAGRKGITAIVEIPPAVLASDEARTASRPATRPAEEGTDRSVVVALPGAVPPAPPAAGRAESATSFGPDPQERSAPPTSELTAPPSETTAPAAQTTPAGSDLPEPPPPPVPTPPVPTPPAPPAADHDAPTTPRVPAVEPHPPAAATPPEEARRDEGYTPPQVARRDEGYTPPPAVTIPERTAPPAAASPPPAPARAEETPPSPVPPLPSSTDTGSSMLFLAKEPPSSSRSPFSRKARRTRKEQEQHPAPGSALSAQPRTTMGPTASAPTPAVTTTATTSTPATTGGSTIDDIDQLAQYASRLPQRTPGGSLAPGLREQQPEPEPAGGSGSSPEARQALSAFQNAARSARRSTDATREHPS